MFVDNASIHGNNSNLPLLNNMCVEFLPPLTTSILQPLNQGVIVFLKGQQKRKFAQRAIDLI